jgi:PAS domain S-box-containing protein
MRLFSSLMRLGANVIEKILLTNREKSRHRYEIMLAIAQAMSRSLSLHQILSASLTVICERLDVDAGAVWLLEEDGITLRLFYHLHAPQQIIEELGEAMDVRSDPVWHLMARNRKAISLEEYPEPKLANMLKAEGFKALTAVPLIHHEKVLGRFGLGRRSDKAFTEKELQLLTAIGEQLGVAVANALLYEKTRSLARQMEAVFDAAREGFLLVGCDNRILSLNKAFAQLLDMEPDDLVGKCCDSVSELLKQKMKEVENSLKHIISIKTDSHDVIEVEFEMTDPPRILSCYSRPVFDEHNNPLGRMWVVRDITEERRQRQELLQLERLNSLGEIAGGVAHDFNNVLFSIIGYAELLTHSNLDERAKMYVERILTSARDAIHIVARMQAFYRAHREPSERAFIDINELLQQVIDLTSNRWKDDAERRGIVIKLVTEFKEVSQIEGVAPELRQAFINILLNAIDAMPDGGTLTVSTWQDNAQVCIAISDTGVGMSERIRSQIFKPFFTTKGRGTGLGLSITNRIVKEHGGMISVESEPGKGSTFIVRLPVGEQAIEEEPARQDIGGPESGYALRILLVDDDLGSLRVLKEMLRILGHDVVTARDGIEGMEKFRQMLFDLVITDLGIPGMNGFQVAEAIHAVASQKPVILLTGWGDVFNEEQLQHAGISDVLRKPTTLKTLQESISKVMHSGNRC